MKITSTDTGKWDVENVGTIERTTQGAYVVKIPKPTQLTDEQIEQIGKFIRDEKNL